MENSNLGNTGGIPGRKYRHNKEQAPKAADKYRGDYEKMKKKGEAMQKRREDAGIPTYGGKKNVKTELKNSEDVRKARKQLEKRKEKNARPSKKGKGR